MQLYTVFIILNVIHFRITCVTKFVLRSILYSERIYGSYCIRKHESFRQTNIKEICITFQLFMVLFFNMKMNPNYCSSNSSSCNFFASFVFCRCGMNVFLCYVIIN